MLAAAEDTSQERVGGPYFQKVGLKTMAEAETVFRRG